MFLLSFFLGLTMASTSHGIVTTQPRKADSAWSTEGFSVISDADLRHGLQEKSYWISAEFRKQNTGPVLQMTKAWRTSASAIQELSTLSGPEKENWILERNEDESYPWTRSQAKLNAERLHQIWNSKDETPVIKQITFHSFILEFSDTFILLFASSDTKPPTIKAPIQPSPVFETPWPFLPDFIIGEKLFGPPPGKTLPIVASPTALPRILSVTPQFPEVFTAVISSASDEWNKATQLALFGGRGPNVPSLWTCFIQDIVCFHWVGTSEVSLVGLSATTQFLHDPITGKKFGSVIQFLNLPPGGVSQTRSRHFSETLPVPSKDVLKQTLIVLMGVTKPQEQLHPFPTKLIKSFVIHELGHDLGLKHDFAASTISDVTRPDTPVSVMDYLPWPIMHLVTRPGHLDVSRVRASMGFITPASKHSLSVHCSDPDSGKASHCTGSDWGNPYAWLNTAATLDPSLQTKLYRGGGLQAFRDEGVPIEELIQTLLAEDPVASKLTPQMIKRLRSHIDQKRRPQ